MLFNLVNKLSNPVLIQSTKPCILQSSIMNKGLSGGFSLRGLKQQPVTCRRFCFKSIFVPNVSKLRNNVFSQPTNRLFSTTSTTFKKEIVTVTFVKVNGEKIVAQGKEGDSLLDVVVDKSVDIDGFGACEGTLACSTCHLIFSEEDFEKIKDKPTDEEMDMLDLAFGLTDTSRLGCQVFLTKELNGIEVQVPDTINDARQ